MRSPPQSVPVLSTSATAAPVTIVCLSVSGNKSYGIMRRLKHGAVLGMACFALYAANAIASDNIATATKLASFFTFNFTGRADVTASDTTAKTESGSWRPPMTGNSVQSRNDRPFFLPPNAILLPDVPAHDLQRKILEPGSRQPEAQMDQVKSAKSETADKSAKTARSKPAKLDQIDNPHPPAQIVRDILAKDLNEQVTSNQQESAKSEPAVRVTDSHADNAKSEANNEATAHELGEATAELELPPATPNPNGDLITASKPVERVAMTIIDRLPTHAANSEKPAPTSRPFAAKEKARSAGPAPIATSAAKPVMPPTDLQPGTGITDTADHSETAEKPANDPITSEEVGSAAIPPLASSSVGQPETTPPASLTESDETAASTTQLLVPLPAAKPRREELRKRAAARRRARERRERAKARADRRRSAARARAQKKAASKPAAQQTKTSNWTKSAFSIRN